MGLINPGLGQRVPLLTLAETQVANKKLAENGKEFDGSVVALRFFSPPRTFYESPGLMLFYLPNHIKQ